MAVYIMEVFVEIKSSLSFKSIMFLLNFIVLILMEKITEPVFKSHYLLPFPSTNPEISIMPLYNRTISSNHILTYQYKLVLPAHDYNKNHTVRVFVVCSVLLNTMFFSIIHAV